MARMNRGPEDGPPPPNPAANAPGVGRVNSSSSNQDLQGPFVLSGPSGGQLTLPRRAGAVPHSTASTFGFLGGSVDPHRSRSRVEQQRTFPAFGAPHSRCHGTQAPTHLEPVHSIYGPRAVLPIQGCSTMPSESTPHNQVLAQSLSPITPPSRPSRPHLPASNSPLLQDRTVEESEPEHPSVAGSRWASGNVSQAEVDEMCHGMTSSQVNQVALGVEFQLSEDEYCTPKQRSSTAQNEGSFLRTDKPASDTNLAAPTAAPSMWLPTTPSRSRSTIPTSTPKVVNVAQRANSQQPQGHFGSLGDLHQHPQASFVLPKSRSTSPAPSEQEDTPTKNGRLTRAESEILQEAVLQSHSILKKACNSIGRPLDIGINRFNATMLGTPKARALKPKHTGWNLYTALVHTAPYDEVKRLGMVYSSDIKVNDAMFRSFKSHYGDHWMEYLITHYDVTNTTDKTIAEREREHRKTMKQFRLALEGAEKEFGFQFVLLSSGSSVNEDQSIGSYYASKSLHGFPEKRLKMSADDLIGHVKTHAYDLVSQEHALQAAAEREAEAKGSSNSDGLAVASIRGSPISAHAAKQVNPTVSNSKSELSQTGIDLDERVPTAGTNLLNSSLRQGSSIKSTEPIASSSRQAGTTPTASSSRLPLGAHLKPNSTAPPNAVLTAVVGLSDDEIRRAVLALNKPDLCQVAEDLLSISVVDTAGTTIKEPAARTFIKNWVSMSFELLGLPRRSAAYFDWLKLPATFAQEGLVLVGWAPDVPFLGEPVEGKTHSGIRSLTIDQSRKVVKGFRSGGTGIERRLEDKAALLASELPIYYEGAPPATSASLRGRRYYVNGTFDNLGVWRQAPHRGAKKSRGLSNSARNAERVELGTITKSSTTTIRRKGKSRATIVSGSDDDSDDKALRPPPPKKIKVGGKQVVHADNDGDGNLSPQPSEKSPTPRIRGRKQAKDGLTAQQSEDSEMSSPSPTGPKASAAKLPTMTAPGHTDATAVDSSSLSRATAALPSTFAALPVSSTTSGSSSSSVAHPHVARSGKRKAAHNSPVESSVGRVGNKVKHPRLTVEATSAVSDGLPSSLASIVHPSQHSASQVFAEGPKALPQVSTNIFLGANPVAVGNTAPRSSRIADVGFPPSSVASLRGASHAANVRPASHVVNVDRTPSHNVNVGHAPFHNVNVDADATASHPMNYYPSRPQLEAQTTVRSHDHAAAEWLQQYEQQNLYDQYLQQQYEEEQQQFHQQQQRQRDHQPYRSHPQPRQQLPEPSPQYPQAQHQQYGGRAPSRSNLRSQA